MTTSDARRSWELIAQILDATIELLDLPDFIRQASCLPDRWSNKGESSRFAAASLSIVVANLGTDKTLLVDTVRALGASHADLVSERMSMLVDAENVKSTRLAQSRAAVPDSKALGAALFANR